MTFFTSQNNAEAVLINLLRHYKPFIDTNAVIKKLNCHPYYPNLLALNDVAANFGLECKAYKITNEELRKISCSFIANTTKKDNEFTVVMQVTSQTVKTITNYTRKKITFNNFTDSFTGVVLVANNVSSKTESHLKDRIFKKAGSAKYLVVPILVLFALVSGSVLHFYSGKTVTQGVSTIQECWDLC